MLKNGHFDTTGVFALHVARVLMQTTHYTLGHSLLYPIIFTACCCDLPLPSNRHGIRAVLARFSQFSFFPCLILNEWRTFARSHPVPVRSRPRTVSVPFPSRLALVPFASPSRPVSFQVPRFSSFVQLMTRFYTYVPFCFRLFPSVPSHSVAYIVYSRSICVSFSSLSFLFPFFPCSSRFRFVPCSPFPVRLPFCIP